MTRGMCVCVCVSERESSSARQPDLSLTSDDCTLKPGCEPSAAKQLLLSLLLSPFPSVLCFLILYSFFFLSHTYLTGLPKVQPWGLFGKKISLA